MLSCDTLTSDPEDCENKKAGAFYVQLSTGGYARYKNHWFGERWQWRRSSDDKSSFTFPNNPPEIQAQLYNRLIPKNFGELLLTPIDLTAAPHQQRQRRG